MGDVGINVVRNFDAASTQASVPLSDMETLGDWELVQRFKDGELSVFGVLWDRHKSKIGYHVMRRIENADTANDLMHDIAFKAFNGLDKFKGKSELYTWLHRIAVNTVSNYYVFLSRRPEGALRDLESGQMEQILGFSPSVEDDVVAKELGAIISSVIGGMSDDLKVAITLREIDGLSYEEIAERQGCPVGTVRSRIFRARELLNEVLERYFNGDGQIPEQYLPTQSAPENAL